MNIIRPLIWLMSINSRDRAKFHAWRYNLSTEYNGEFNPLCGRGVSAYEIIDGLDGMLVRRDWPQLTAGLGIVVSKMYNRAYCAFMVPVSLTSEDDHKTYQEKEENELIEKVANYFEKNPSADRDRVYRDELPLALNKWKRVQEVWNDIDREEIKYSVNNAR